MHKKKNHFKKKSIERKNSIKKGKKIKNKIDIEPALFGALVSDLY